MLIRILGAAAGGGLPQWNCGCANCSSARAGRIPPMTQSSIAASADGSTWAIVNASPDIRAQLAATPALHPTGPRDVPLASVLLTNGDIDHVAGLLTLREKQPFALYATAEIHRVLEANPIFRALDPALVERRPVTARGARRPRPRPRSPPLRRPRQGPALPRGRDRRDRPRGRADRRRRACHPRHPRLLHPRLRPPHRRLADRLAGAPLLLFDGTLWDDDEMIRTGLGAKTGRRMGHMPISGEDGSLAAFAGLDIARRVFVHLNNSNPAVDPGSPQAAEARAAGWEIAHDGMEIAL
jgi:pyrroloquinoline quinone biosynthesis protein B